jgi:hypothetical protein
MTVAVVAFFMKLHYSAASEEEEEADGLRCNAAPQQSRLLLLRYSVAP